MLAAIPAVRYYSSVKKLLFSGCFSGFSGRRQTPKKANFLPCGVSASIRAKNSTV